MNQTNQNSARDRYGELYRALGNVPNNWTSNHTTHIEALDKLAALKHVVFEVAAYGSCDCDMERAPREYCVYCVACRVSADMCWDVGMEDPDNRYMNREIGFDPGI